MHESKKPELARAYVPYQEKSTVYPPEEGLRKGTIYPELYKPYHMPRHNECKPCKPILFHDADHYGGN